jgi:NAD(P)-dependent dehydrogenase (short-subunit alcohol dehydrogenase family)
MVLQNQIALITGAAVRVGRTIALELAARGVHIAFTYLDEKESCDETLTEISGKGVEGLAVPMDVRDPAQPGRCVQKVLERFGRIDILINNASVWLSKPFLEIEVDEWNDVMAVNLRGPFLCSQAVARGMLGQKSGVIINIIDLSVIQSWPTYSHHSASKSGLLALTRVMAAELAPHVRVNAVAPGTVLLPDGCGEEKASWAVNNSLLKRIGTPLDVARTVVFLCETDFVTGAVYLVDGGRSLVSQAGMSSPLG